MKQTLDDLLKTAPGNRRRIALVGADHDESLLTVKQALIEETAEFLLLGEKSAIMKRCEFLDLPLKNCNIEDIPDLRTAADRAVLLAAQGKADILMKGGVHTSVFTRALLNRERGLISEGGLISHFALFDIPGLSRPVALTDAALNISPDLEEKKVILENGLSLLRRLKKGPMGAICIAASEKVNPKIPGTADAEALSAMDWEGDRVEGPMALDAALSRQAADVKGIESRLAGKPDLLLFPDLNSANAAYKAFSFFRGVRYCGILAGLDLPVILNSRSDPEWVRSLSLRLALAAS